jgi:hypothetical protein
VGGLLRSRGPSSVVVVVFLFPRCLSLYLSPAHCLYLIVSLSLRDMWWCACSSGVPSRCLKLQRLVLRLMERFAVSPMQCVGGSFCLSAVSSLFSLAFSEVSELGATPVPAVCVPSPLPALHPHAAQQSILSATGMKLTEVQKAPRALLPVFLLSS